MNNQNDLPLLRNFFGAYFHEDWPCEANTPNDVIALYINSGVDEAQIRALAAAINQYNQRFTSETLLEEKLFSELGCYYCPSLDGQSAKEWMGNVAKRLIDELQTR